VARQGRRCIPGNLQLLGGTHGIPFPCGNNSDEIAFADNASARNVTDRTIVDAYDPRSSAVGTLPARANDAAMQHARHARMLRVHIFTANFVRNVVPRNPRANNLIFTRPLQRGFPRKRGAECLAANQFAIGDRLLRIVNDGDDPVSRSTGTFNFFEASVSSVIRASAAAARIRGPPLITEELATVPP